MKIIIVIMKIMKWNIIIIIVIILMCVWKY